jgi:anaerobic selenocysteine-containing dehydrogenase
MAARRGAFDGLSWHDIGERGARGPAAPAPAAAAPAPQIAEGEPTGMVVVGYRQLMSGPSVDHAPVLHFQRRGGIEIAHDDAQRLGVATGDRVEVVYGEQTRAGAAVVQRRLRAGVVRMATDVPYVGPGELQAAPEEPASA